MLKCKKNKKKIKKPDPKEYENLVKLDSFKEDSTSSEESDAPQKKETGLTKEKARERAFEFANDCRNNEIDRFWSRGTYFWGFIATSFAAYMAVFNASLPNDEGGIKIAVTLKAILEMSFTSKVALFILSFICFIFCLSWLLIHKGSKYWQENWETHIYYLEKEYMGEIYWTYLDTDNKNRFKKWNIFSVKPYNFSVTKISTLCSNLLAVCSFGLSLIHFIILIFAVFKSDFKISELSYTYKFLGKLIFLIVIFVLSVLFIIFYICRVFGNSDAKKKKNDEKNDTADKTKDSEKFKYDEDHDYFRNKHTPKDETDNEITVKIAEIDKYQRNL